MNNVELALSPKTGLVYSLDAPAPYEINSKKYDGDEENYNLYSYLGLPLDDTDPSELAIKNILRDYLSSCLDRLEKINKKQADVLKLRYGFADGVFYTLEEVGNMESFGMTKEGVRQNEAKGLKNLRAMILEDGVITSSNGTVRTRDR